MSALLQADTIANSAGTGAPSFNAGLIVSSGQVAQVNNIQGASGSGGVGIQGTNTNNNATAGNTGEYIVNNIAAGTAVASANNTVGDYATLTLTAGDWEVGGDFLLQNNSATFTTLQFFYGIWSASGTSTTGSVQGYNQFEFDGLTSTGTNQTSLKFPTLRVQSDGTNLFFAGQTGSATQVIRMKMRIANFTSGSPQYGATFYARRLR